MLKSNSPNSYISVKMINENCIPEKVLTGYRNVNKICLYYLFFQLVVHVGVSGIADKITLEQRAHNLGYHRKDIGGKTPTQECCQEDGEECICTGIDMSQVSDEINKADNRLEAEVSHDAGR